MMLRTAFGALLALALAAALLQVLAVPAEVQVTVLAAGVAVAVTALAYAAWERGPDPAGDRAIAASEPAGADRDAQPAVH